MSNEPQIKLPGFLVVMAIVGLFALLGYMDNRDREDMAERNREALNRIASECAPKFDMPIQEVRL